MPWSKGIDPVAPEEQEIPDPDSFSGALSFLEKSYEDSCKEYLEMLPERITPQFMKSTNVFQLLRTLGLEVFVPASWEGIRGVEPLRLEFKDTLPQRLKPAARPIPRELMKNVTEEIERLKGYFWEPSTSSITSPLVVAQKQRNHLFVFVAIIELLTNTSWSSTIQYPMLSENFTKQKTLKYLWT